MTIGQRLLANPLRYVIIPVFVCMLFWLLKVIYDCKRGIKENKGLCKTEKNIHGWLLSYSPILVLIKKKTVVYIPTEPIY